MDAILNSFLLVAAAEMGDKTQLLALVLTCKYKKPWTILFAILLATLLNHALAAYVGTWLSHFFQPLVLKWILFSIFMGFAIWILFPDKEEEVSDANSYNVFLTTLMLFFWAEMGDKTQLATIAMAARYQNAFLVTVGTTLGMMFSNGLAVLLGNRIRRIVHMNWIRRIASVLFALFGILILFQF